MLKPFIIVEPYVDGPRRFHDATVLSEHETAADAFAELARLTERLQRFGIAPERFQWVVVDAKRRPVRGPLKAEAHLRSGAALEVAGWTRQAGRDPT